MLQFEHIAFLWAIPGLLIFGLLAQGQWVRIQRQRSKLADAGLFEVLNEEYAAHKRTPRSWWWGLLALGLWAVALANPQWGTRKRIAEVQSTQVVLALDISQSMLVQDIRPDRLTRAQSFLQDLLNAFDGEQVGLLLFAGNAYLQMPLSTDYGAAQLLVRSASPNQAPTQGTNFTAAIDLAAKLMAPKEGQSTAVRRILVLVSDGENHEDLVLERIAALRAEQGLSILTVGVGTEAGGRIPVPNAGRGSFKRDEGGEAVISKFDNTTLKAIADAGGGTYFDMRVNAVGLAGALANTIQQGDAEVIGEEVFIESASYFQLFLGLGLLAWILAFWSEKNVQSTRNPKPASHDA